MENNALTELKNIEISSLSDLRHRDIVRIIKSINEEKKYWEAKDEQWIRPIPNMSGRRYNPNDRVTVIKDYFANKEFDLSLQKLILVAAVKSKIVLHVHQDIFGFAPIFAVLEGPRLFSKNKSECLIKFQKHNFSSENFSEFITVLYSKKNKKKLSRIGKKIEKLSSYDY